MNKNIHHDSMEIDEKGFVVDKIAYIKTIKSEEIPSLFNLEQHVENIMPGQDLYALLDDKGKAIMVSDKKEAILLRAADHNIIAQSVH